ncbi:MAG: hypothetical protein CVT92_08260, partial [Bacteroidetes bacterium HGW-Bacteroidetes-1]
SLFFHNFMVLIVNTIKVAKSRQRLQLPFRFRSTKAICNKGFSGNSIILPRSNFGVGGQESSPQSLTAYSLNRCAQA